MSIVYSYSFYKRSKITSKQGYLDLSFSREEPNFLLEINCSKKNEYLANNSFLLFSNEDFTKNIFTYKLEYPDKKELNKIKDYIKESEEINDIKYSIYEESLFSISFIKLF